jgi:orotidine-5'-phosphate decarboxylase
MSKPVHLQTYLERSKSHPNPAAKRLLEIMQEKESNLCLSIDVTAKDKLLKIVDAVGAELCLLKVSAR